MLISTRCLFLLEFSSKDIQKATDSIVSQIDGPFLSIHLRNGADWLRACELISSHGLKSLMASPQCDLPELKMSHCLQTETLIIDTLSRLQHRFKTIFISTDFESYRHPIELLGFNVVQQRDFKTEINADLAPLVDLAIHAKSSLFIANCVSSFSSFAVRQRAVKDLDTIFWGVFDNVHAEL